jgi:hypothetical protein
MALVGGRGGRWVAVAIPVAVGVGIAVLGPQLWREAVFLTFGA